MSVLLQCFIAKDIYSEKKASFIIQIALLTLAYIFSIIVFVLMHFVGGKSFTPYLRFV